jgi:hypothetical protein
VGSTNKGPDGIDTCRSYHRQVEQVIVRTPHAANRVRTSKLPRFMAIWLIFCAFQVHAGPADSMQAPERMHIAEPRNAAAGFAVTTWMVQVDSLGTHCAKLEGQTGKDALHALTSWQERNMPYVDASLAYIARIGEFLLASHGEGAKKQFLDDRGDEFATAGRKAQVELLPEGRATERDCLKLTTHTTRGELDLDMHAEFFPILQAIKADMDRMGSP